MKRMPGIILITLGLVLSSRAALALPPPPPPPPQWTGFYEGLNAGVGWSNSNQQAINVGGYVGYNGQGQGQSSDLLGGRLTGQVYVQPNGSYGARVSGSGHVLQNTGQFSQGLNGGW